jgi:hypothetical protein
MPARRRESLRIWLSALLFLGVPSAGTSFEMAGPRKQNARSSLRRGANSMIDRPAPGARAYGADARRQNPCKESVCDLRIRGPNGFARVDPPLGIAVLPAFPSPDPDDRRGEGTSPARVKQAGSAL